MRARVVVLAASCCESARLLLNSKSSRFPNGLANSSGVVGKYLTDSTGLSVSGFIPEADGHAALQRGRRRRHALYVPWWGDNKKLGFPRGYHIELGGGFGMPGYGFSGGIQNYPQSRGGGYGAELKDEYRRYYGAFVSFAGRGEQVVARGLLLRDRPERRRSLGHPGAALPPHVERPGAPAGQAHAGDLPQHHPGDGRHADVADAAKEQDYGLAVGGLIIHEAGATRMGNDPKTSVLNTHCQAHDVKNVFVADGGPFVSQADKNLTWTIMALAWRTSEYIADERKKGNI